jgi:hypothetical protein
MCGDLIIKENPFGVVALCTETQTSDLAGAMLRINCPFFGPLLDPQHPLPPLYTCEHLLSLTTSTCLNLLLLGTGQ